MTEATHESRSAGDLVFVGDVHLDCADRHLEAFLGFLDGLKRNTSRLVLLGDLFNLWIGGAGTEQPYQRAVISRLAELRQAGIRVRYVEGNRDYRIASAHVGSALDEATLEGLSEEFGGRRLWAIHGDLANPADTSYRRWRSLSRSSAFWRLFRLFPAGSRMRAAEYLERKLRARNREFKGSFPEREVRDYGARFLARGFDTVVLGHFHVERDLTIQTDAAAGRILVLPEWRSSRRHLRVDRGGGVEFVDSL